MKRMNKKGLVGGGILLVIIGLLTIPPILLEVIGIPLGSILIPIISIVGIILMGWIGLKFLPF